MLLLAAVAANLAAQPKAIFYMTGKPESVRSFLAHADKIDIVIPEFYSADAEGAVRGNPESIVMEAARKHRVPVMPIIVNPGFKQDQIHALLGNAAAQARLAKALLEECRKHGYYGIQFDFEHVPAADRDALTRLVRDTAALLGGGGFELSIAAMYQTSEAAPAGGYARWLYDNWLGAYDLREIAKHVEFISVMTYDQHTERTPPGPIAGFPWAEEVVQYCLKLVPKEKFSLGIPLYGRRWYAGAPGNDASMVTATVNAHEAVELAAQMKVEPQWDAQERAPWFYFYRDGVREYVYYNDAHSFRERYELARQRGLHSFSAWVLGAEDTEIWKEMPGVRR